MLVIIKIINVVNEYGWLVRWKKNLWCCFAVYPSLDVFAPHTGKKKPNKPQNNPKKKKH